MIDVHELGVEIRSAINGAAANSPRSKQKSIGPSEVGTPCIRRIGYRLLDVESVNQADTWLATIGTAVHAWLAATYEAANQALGRERYLVEQRVQVDESLGGSVDIYDVDRRLVLDWKVVGDTSLKRYKSKGPGDQYETQVQLYGKGFANAGHPVEHVGIAFLPRGGSLRGLHIWTAPYDEEKAKTALQRLEIARTVTATAGIEALALLPAVESFCNFCPFFLPASTNLRVGCPGADQ
jgi:hypothetical protein